MTTTAGPFRWNTNACRLLLCGLAVLFWELVLIRWLGGTLRVVAYFSNLVLISAFFGLGVGALLARFSVRLERLIAPLAALTVTLGVWLGRFQHPNPDSASDADEYIWLGRPAGILGGLGPGGLRMVSVGLLLVLVYTLTAALFAAFGQYLGRLFRTHRPLPAYTVEVAGSLLGIALFALLSKLQAGPVVWFAIGSLLLLAMLPWRVPDALVTLVMAGLMLAGAWAESRGHTWSPYYRIALGPLTSISEPGRGREVPLSEGAGYVLTVNNDYHQMMLDLRRPEQHPFVAGWRAFYDAPYASYEGMESLPPGRILVIGAGTGNDVAAALRSTDRMVTAVEIDPVIAALGRRLHPERPYDDPRVQLVIDDARSFFHRARDGEYAAVVFGFLDSHRLLSSFGSVRLDNFIYTSESMKEVRRLLVPGGRVAVSFASNRPWIHARLVGLVEEGFGSRPLLVRDASGYANGILYLGQRTSSDEPTEASRSAVVVPTDDWPFLYLRQRSIPPHNVLFLFVALALSAGAFLVLPKGERRIRLPYLLLGAAFFLLETSNVVRMALLFGSTWWVNTVVFAGILALVLLANLAASRWRIALGPCMVALAVGILLAATLPSSLLLDLPSIARAGVAVLIYLGPVFFGGLIFARLIEDERRLYEAYGSNVLGAVLGGTAEYLSVLFGFEFLFALALVCYLGVFLLLRGRATPAMA
jgi:SAM-dependent methyltransferase